MKKFLLIVIAEAKDFVEYFVPIIIQTIKSVIIYLASLGLLVAFYYGVHYAGEFWDNMRYEALQEAQAGYEAVFLELMESYKEYEDTFARVEEVSKKYRLRNQAIKEAVSKANSLIAELEAKQREAKEAFEYAQGQIHADKEAVLSYTAQLEEVLQAQQKAIYALQEYIQTQTLESLQAKNKRK